MTKLKKSRFDNKKKVTMLKKSNSDIYIWRTQEPKLWQKKLKKKKSQSVKKKKIMFHSKIQIMTTLKNSNCDDTQKLKFWQNH